MFPTSEKLIECSECEQIFNVSHNFAMHMYKNHKYDFNCDHCKKNLPGEDFMFEIHLKLCTSPCDGHPRCPCKFISYEQFLFFLYIVTSVATVKAQNNVIVVTCLWQEPMILAVDNKYE